MKDILHYFFFCTSLLLPTQSMFASHIIGGEMSYTCLGNNQYQITLKVFRDCFNGQAGYDDPTYITIYDASNIQVQGSPFAVTFPGSDELDNPGNPCLIIPPGICVEEADFITTITLPETAGGLTMVYQRCCRNQIMINIDDPSNTGASYVATIPDTTLAGCNSSPYFNNFPPTVICVDQSFSFDHSATDPDGDSLVYQLCSPFNGGQDGNVYPVPADPPPYAFVNFLFPYSASNPMGGNPPMTINPGTGLLTVTPNSIGNYVVGICVEEFRNGNLLGEHKRDFQFNVVECNILLNADFSAPDGIVNQPIQFTDLSTTDSGYINSWSWDFGDGGNSNIQNPSHSYQTAGDFVVILTITNSIGCTAQYYVIIHVDYAIGIISPEFSYSDQPATIYNIYGQKESAHLIYQTGNCWTTGDESLSAGIYFIEYRTLTGSIVKKIVVQR